MILSALLQIYSLILLARVLLSWFPNVDPNSPIVRFLYEATEHILQPIRRSLPRTGGIDFSPLIVLVGIQVLHSLLLRLF